MAATPRKRAEPSPADVVSATAAWVAGLPIPLRTSPEALVAHQLAATLAATTSARDIATVSKELRATLDDLRARASEVKGAGDVVDEIRARRDARRAAAG